MTNRRLRLLRLRCSSLPLATVLLLGMSIVFASFCFKQSPSDWLILISTILGLSLLALLWRAGPVIWRDMVHYRHVSQVTRMQTMHNHVSWRFASSPKILSEKCRHVLAEQAYRVQLSSDNEQYLISAMKGRLNRLGLLLSHAAVLLILLAAFMDSDLAMSYQISAGKLTTESRRIALNEMSSDKRISARSRLAFQGSEQVMAGQIIDEVRVVTPKGNLTKNLPYPVSVNSVEMDTNLLLQENNFLTRVAILDSRLDTPVMAILGTNQPFRYKGYVYYQQAVADGGSELTVAMWPLQHARVTPLKFRTLIGNERELQTRQGTINTQFTDLKPRNIQSVQENLHSQPVYKNIGPSLFYRIDDELSRQREYVNYLLPVLQKGRYFFISGMRDNPQAAFRYLHIPADRSGGLQHFFELHAALYDPEQTRKAIYKVLSDAGKTISSDEGKALQTTLQELLQLFRQGGFAAVDKNIAQRVEADNYQQSQQLSRKFVRSLLYAMYIASYSKQDSTKQMDEKDILFFEDAMPALSSMAEEVMPFYIQLEDMVYKPSVSLLVSYRPGEFMFFIGWLMLITGLAASYYTYYRRIWLILRKDGEQTMVSMAGMGHRQGLLFGREFNDLFARLQKAMQV